MNLSDAATEALAISIASKTTYSGSAAAILGWFMAINWLGVVGAIVAVSGLIINFIFLLRRDRRETLEHIKRMHQYDELPEDNNGTTRNTKQ